MKNQDASCTQHLLTVAQLLLRDHYPYEIIRIYMLYYTLA